jgi:DNA-binding NarL/FixJ family response regulator
MFGGDETQEKQTARVFLADPQPVLLAGLRGLIGGTGDLEVAGEASSGLAALRGAKSSAADIVVLDFELPDLAGLKLLARLGTDMPDMKAVVFTGRDERSSVMDALAAGARGYVLKRSSGDSLVHALRCVMAGGVYVDAAVAQLVLQPTIHPRAQKSVGPPPRNVLTERERDVLRYTALGLRNKEISARLGIGVKSVETYKARGAEKLCLNSRAAIVTYAMKEGWLRDG